MIYWQRQFGPYQPAVAVKVIKMLKQNGCRSVSLHPGRHVSAKVPMSHFDTILKKLEQLSEPNP